MVADRRGEKKKHLLVSPSRLICWPRLMSVLGDTNPTPVRLRNNRVALLLETDFNIKDLPRKITKGLKKRSSFDPITGFSDLKPRRFHLWYLLPVCALLVFFLMPLEAEKTKDARLNTITECSVVPSAGMTVSKAQVNSKKLIIGESEFRVTARTRFGGLREVQLERTCDKKLFQLRLWDAGDYFRLSSVD